jgi:hypothetical protein
MTGSSPDYSTSELLEMRARAALVGALDASLDSSHPARYPRLNSTPILILMAVGDYETRYFDAAGGYEALATAN